MPKNKSLNSIFGTRDAKPNVQQHVDTEEKNPRNRNEASVGTSRLTDQEETLLAERAGDYVTRRRAGEHPSMKDYLAALPLHLRDDFRMVVNMSQLLEIKRQPGLDVG